MKVDRFTKTVVLLNCIVPVTLLGWDACFGSLAPIQLTSPSIRPEC